MANYSELAQQVGSRPAPGDGDETGLGNALLGGEELLSALSQDLERLKNQKARAGVEGRTLLNISFMEGEHDVSYSNSTLYNEPHETNKLYLKFNLLGRRVSKLLGRLTSMDPPFKAQPDRKDPQALNEAESVDALIRATDQKLDQHSRMWEILYWVVGAGTAFEHVPWVPNATVEPMPQFDESTGELLWKNLLSGEVVPESVKDSSPQPPETFQIYEDVELVGDIGSEIFGPLNVFIDQGVRSIADLAPDQRVHIARIRTMGWIKDNFDVEVEPAKNFEIISSRFTPSNEAVGGLALRDMVPLVQGTASADDPPMAVVVESYAPPSKDNPSGRYTCWIPGQKILHDDVCPYGEIPIVDYHWRPVTTSFWTKDYVTDLIAPQRFLNKRVSQLGEQSNASLYSQILLGGALKAKDVNADRPGVIEGAISDNGYPMVQRLAPPEIPQWYMQSLDSVIRLFNDIAGGTDLTEDTKFPGQLRGPMAVPMLQEIIDTEWGPFFNHLGQRLALVKQMRLNRVKQFYPPVRTMHYTSRDQKDEILQFHTDKVLRSGTNFNITIERGALMPELRSLREARVRERLASPLAIMYMDERTGRLDKSKIAQDLQFGDTGREGREAQYRRLGQEIVELLWQGKTVPPVQPFYDHTAMMDELESAMATTEYLRCSPQIQQLFIAQWQQHEQFLQQQAQAQQQALQGQQIQSAVAMATQQAAATAAADAVHQAMSQVGAQNQLQQNGTTDQLVHAAQGGAAPQPRQQPQRPPAPAGMGGPQQ